MPAPPPPSSPPRAAAGPHGPMGPAMAAGHGLGHGDGDGDGDGRAGGTEAAPFAPDLHDARHLWLKAVLLLAWAAVSFGACYFVRDLTWRLGDWPLGYWIASQGAVLAFIAIVVAYCVAMDRFERADARVAADMQAAGGTVVAAAPAQAPATGRAPRSHG